MSTKHIERERIRRLNDREERDGDYVLYWMQQSQREDTNHALEYAAGRANEKGRRLLVVFGLMDDYPEANLRHYRFLVEGLRETREALEGRGIRMVVHRGNPHEVALERASDAALVVCDRGYLRHQKEWRRRVAEEAPSPVVEVESDVVVPVDVVTRKAEYAARTIRPKIRKHLEKFLVGLRRTAIEKDSLNLPNDGLDLDDLDRILDDLKLDRSVAPVSELFRGGTSEAKRLLRRFRSQRLDGYDDHRNQPQTDYVSHIAKYLHFGQISPIWVANTIGETKGAPGIDRKSYLEELVVRRELAQNFVNFTRDYDAYRALPGWARKTLEEHRDDPREHVYTRKELEEARTHDPYWNAAMREMRLTGYMHNYMRMYWGKKILQWTNTPEYAHRVALELNNRYFLDGRDANSYANVGWIFGLHDRPWKERPVFGKVRYMSAKGLERKCDIEGYVRKVDELEATLTERS